MKKTLLFTNLILFSLCYAQTTLAQQVTSDGSLSTTVQTITNPTTNAKIFTITGGTTAQNNLFHSFSEFSLPNSSTAIFNPSPNIVNIFSRVTGNLPSDINGKITVNNSNTNLFLINPNGITFGPNARLIINGSFLATTANAIGFNNVGNFGVNTGNDVALLTINPSALLYNQINPNANITNQATLTLPTGKNLVFAGGNINLKDRNIIVPGGRVELTGLTQPGTIKLDTSNFSLSGLENLSLADVNITNNAAITVRSGGGGDIVIDAKNLQMTNSHLRAGIGQNLGSNTALAGHIYLNIQENIHLDDSIIVNDIRSGGTGTGGNVNINTNSISLNNGAQILAVTLGHGHAGNVNINANQVVFDGVFDDGNGNGFATGVFSTVESTGVGNGGTISINAQTLTLTNGAELVADNRENSQGNAGNIIVKVQDEISLDGVSNFGFSTGLFSNTSKNATGTGGTIQVEANTLKISNGAVLAARSKNDFSGGIITVNVNNLSLLNGGEILTTAFAGGNAGSINVNALKNLEISGLDSTYDQRLEKFGSDTVDPSTAFSGIFANTNTGSTAKAGNINITTQNLSIQNNGMIAVGSRGTGDGGTLNINAKNDFNLQEKGLIIAGTNSGEGGNIIINADKALIMLKNSLINTNAGGSGNGGDITINSPFILAIDTENSDITANAIKGRGGNISITTQGIFGIQFRQNTTDFSDITASSEFGVNGTVTISTPGIDPAKGLNQLSNSPIDLSKLVADNCRTIANSNNFVVTGRGGLPYDPQDALDAPIVLADFGSTKPQNYSTKSTEIKQENLTSSDQILEAQGWIINNKGQIVLITDTKNLTVNHPRYLPRQCLKN